jgi:hypothetical protein
VRSIIKRAVVAFGRFWWDFLIGDTPELFVGTLAIVGSALLLRHDRVAGLSVVVVLAVVFLLASTYRGRAVTRSAPNDDVPPGGVVDLLRWAADRAARRR